MSAIKNASKPQIAFEERKPLQPDIILKFINGISQIFCLTIPNVYNYNGLSVWYLLYSLLLVSLLILILCWTVKSKLEDYYSFIDKTCALDLMVMVFYTVSNSVTIIGTVIFQRKNLVAAIRYIEDLGNLHEMPLILKSCNDTKLFLALVGLLHTCIGAILLTSIVLFYFGKINVIFSIIRFVNLYIVIITTLQIQN
ncbi:uncharacterized protein LOC116165040, partial [Photinus pyralis]|uniref:uncharacterized protein LOC116165040 n=1 Tax=Photinus pyralis TaxID=7054 RepID=UPI0012671C54